MKFERVLVRVKRAMRQVRIGYRLAIIFSLKVASYIVALHVWVLVFGSDAIYRFAHNAEVSLRDLAGVSLFVRIEIAFLIGNVFFIMRTVIVEVLEKEMQEIADKKE